MTRLLFYLQPLLGLGHDARAAAIARRLVASGIDVTIVTGSHTTLTFDRIGVPVKCLPSLRAADADYSGLIDASGRAPDEALWQSRLDGLMSAFAEAAPDVLLVETFPFGRWPFRREILPLLDAARGRCRIACSVRDILEPKAEPQRNFGIAALIDRYFDLVLVHGDPNLVPLERSFSHASAIADRVRYTGYVLADEPPEVGGDMSGTEEIVVSAGGGATCASLMSVALAAAHLHDHRWRFLIGPNCPATVRECVMGTPAVVAEPVRPDFRAVLRRAALSISQAGYNTTLDILCSGVRSIMVPYTGFGQREQAMRAELMAASGGVTLLTEDRLSPRSLLSCVESSLARQVPRIHPPNLDGAGETARLLEALCFSGNAAYRRI